MTAYRLTFGEMYRREEHPTLPQEWANPDGYMLIEAPTQELARQIAYGLCWTGDRLAYSDLNAYNPTHDHYYPDGVTVTITAATSTPPRPGEWG